MIDIASRILYEDNHILIFNKACSELVQGDSSGDSSLLDVLKDFIKERDSKPGNVFLGLVNRLDRPTSGAVVFAKTSKGLSRMNELFRSGDVEKRYWALTDGIPGDTEGELVDYLIKDAARNKSSAYPVEGKNRKKGVLRYKLIAGTDRYYVLEVELETGRHHQIRAQLSSRGVHIRGDLKYGAKRSNPRGGISLHSRSIGFIHPVSKAAIHIEADPRPVQDDELWKKLPLWDTIET